MWVDDLLCLVLVAVTDFYFALGSLYTVIAMASLL